MEIPRERGFQKPCFLKESMRLKWNFQRVGGGGVGGIQTKKPSVGGVWIFSGTTHCFYKFGDNYKIPSFSIQSKEAEMNITYVCSFLRVSQITRGHKNLSLHGLGGCCLNIREF